MTHLPIHPWKLTGASDQLIYGDTHLPLGQPKGVVLMTHGLKSYKDYGFGPALAAHMAKLGFVAHRFNFSHSGMTNDLATFARPDLFELDTWNKQVTDLLIVAQAVRRGALAGATAGNKLPQFWLGHSRGGITTLLAAGRSFAQDAAIKPAGVITLAAGDDCMRLSPQERQLMEKQGFLEMFSSRTSQVLNQGKAWLTEQIEDPHGHDLLAAAEAIKCPLLIVHGKQDDTVPFASAINIKAAADNAGNPHVKFVSMPGASHTFNAPNPLPLDAELPDITREMFEHVGQFALSLTTTRS